MGIFKCQMLDKCQWYSLDATNVEDEKTINTVWMSQMWKWKKKFFCSWQYLNMHSQKKTEAMFWKYSGSTEIWTRIAGFRVLSANHYTIGPQCRGTLIYGDLLLTSALHCHFHRTEHCLVGTYSLANPTHISILWCQPSMAVVAEWLRRLTRNQFPSGSVGSNPTDCESFFFGMLSDLLLFVFPIPKVFLRKVDICPLKP